MKKDVIKEEWSQHVMKCADCIVVNDYRKAIECMNEAISCIRDMETEHNYYSNPITNFGVLNRLVSENLAEIKEKSPAFLKEWVSLINEDKNLKNQYVMYYGLERFDESCSASNYITEAIDIAKSCIDLATLEESNMSAFNLLKKHELIIPNTLSEETNKYYESCHYLLENKKDSITLVEHVKANNVISEYIKTQSKDNVTEALLNMNSVLSKLTEDELRIAEALSGDEKTQKALFEELKSACIDKVHKTLLDESEEKDAEEVLRLERIEESLKKSEYKPEKFSEDVIKFIEFQEI